MPDTPSTSSPYPDRSDRAWTERTGVVALDDGHDPWEALARLARVHGPHLAPLVRVSPVPDGSALALTHLVPVGAVTLAGLREQAPLRAGHVVTVALAVTGALAALHDAGLAHGGVTPDAVLVAPDGGVVLAGAGLAWRPGPGAPGGPTPSDDIDAVGELVRDLLGTGGGASGLVIASLRASDPDPAARPTAAALHDLVRLVAPAAPLLELLWTPSPVRIDPRTPPAPAQPVVVPPEPTVATVTAADDPVPLRTPQGRELPVRGGRRQPRSRTSGRGPGGRGRVAAVAALACAGLALVAVARSGTGQAEASDGGALEGVAATPSHSVAPTATATAPATAMPTGEAALDLDRGAGVDDWAGVLEELDTLRTRALERGSLDELATVVDRHGTAWVADAALARRVSAAHATVRGGSLVVTDVRVASVAATAAALVVRDRRTAYSVTVDGSTQQVPERPARWWQVRLVRDGDRWLIEDVEALDEKDVTWTSPAVSTRRAP